MLKVLYLLHAVNSGKPFMEVINVYQCILNFRGSYCGISSGPHSQLNAIANVHTERISEIDLPPHNKITVYKCKKSAQYCHFQRHFPINKIKHSICNKNNKVVINNWQTLTLFICKSTNFLRSFTSQDTEPVTQMIENQDSLFKQISHGVYVIGVSDGNHQNAFTAAAW